MIMHVLKVGCRWVDCPKAYGPHKTIYNRFARWSERGTSSPPFFVPPNDLAARRIDQAGDDTARKVNAEVVRAALIHELSGTRSGLRSRAAKSLSRAVAPPISFNNGWTTGMNHARSTS
jgi:hypothetical protein